MRFNEDLTSGRYTFFTASGFLTGSVKSVEPNGNDRIFELEDVSIRAVNSDSYEHVPFCELMSQHVIALVPAIDEPSR